MTHHIFTFGDKYKSVMDYFRLVFENTNENGTFLIQDPVAPDRPEETIYLLLNKEDGSNEDWNRKFEIDQPELLDAHLKGLSTYARFKRFSEDYLTNNKNFSSRWKVRYEEKMIDGQVYIAVKRKHAAEFMARKDWTDSWMSEMRECFTFWTHDEWKHALEETGWTIEGKDNDPRYGTNVRTDPYKIPRWEGKVEMYELRDGILQKSDLPYTNQTLIARKIADRI
jgi:hypothetical protein